MSTYDKHTMICDNMPLTGTLPVAGIAKLSGSIRLLNGGTTPRISGRDVGPGAPITIRIHVTETFAGLTSLPVSFTLAETEFDSSSAGATGVFFPMLNILAADLVLGREFDVVVPSLPSALIGTGREYMGLLFTPTGTVTAGAVSAWVPLGEAAGIQKRYAKNYTGP